MKKIDYNHIQPLLTAIVLTYNEESNIQACLDSIQPLGCTIFVVDSGSTDKTIEIATAAGANIVNHEFENYGAQRNWAQRHLPILSEWILHVDADERLTDQLRTSIVEALSANDGYAGYLVCRRTMFLGKWIKHGGHYPSYHARLFKMGLGQCEDRLYDQHYIVHGNVAILTGDMIDETWGFDEWWKRHKHWAKMEALEVVKEGDKSGRLKGKISGSAIEKKRWLRQELYYRLPWFVRPTMYFMYRYFVRGGFLDGPKGTVFHVLQGYCYRLIVDFFIMQHKLKIKKLDRL